MTRQAGVYVRISSDPTGQGLGVARQRRACERKAVERGWHVAKVFEDNDVSASTGKRRPAYEGMLQAIRDKQIDAVVVWDLDRLTRQPIEIEHFISLADKFSVDLASVGGDIDLATDNGRMFARIKGAVARAEVERKSARQKAANVQRRENGKPPQGRRLFGFSGDGMSLVDDEAKAVREAADDLIAGKSIHGITRKLNERGFTTTAGNPWKPTEVRRMLQRPRLAGLVSYEGEVIGKGSFPAIIDEDTHHAILGVLADPGRHKAGPPRKYVLSGILTCGVEGCGLPLIGCYDARRGYSHYRCPSRRHVQRRMDWIDDYVERVIVEWLAKPEVLVRLFVKPARDRGKDLQSEQRQLRSRLDGLAEAFASEEIDRAQLRAGTQRLRKRLDVVTAELESIAQVPDATPLLTTEDVAATWRAMDLDKRRTIIRSVLTITLYPAGQGARSFRPQDEIELAWKELSTEDLDRVLHHRRGDPVALALADAIETVLQSYEAAP